MPDAQLALLLALTFLINLIGSLAYSVRIAGIRTRRIAVSMSLFNILVLVSRTSNSFYAPLLAKRVEDDIRAGATAGAVADFRWLLAAASLATVAGALLTPTFQRLLTRAVTAFSLHRSVPRLVVRVFSPGGVTHLREAFVAPTVESVRMRGPGPRVSVRVMLVNTMATAVWTVGVLAALYAAYLEPALRATASNLSGIVNGLATILLFVIVDPYLSVLTDDVVEGRASEALFRRTVVWMLGTRLAGTLLAQVLLLPAAHVVAAAARLL